MSRGSREWKEICKADNRLTRGTSWSRKDMTLASYKTIKRHNRRFSSIKNIAYLINALKDIDEGMAVKIQDSSAMK